MSWYSLLCHINLIVSHREESDNYNLTLLNFSNDMRQFGWYWNMGEYGTRTKDLHHPIYVSIYLCLPFMISWFFNCLIDHKKIYEGSKIQVSNILVSSSIIYNTKIINMKDMYTVYLFFFVLTQVSSQPPRSAH